MSVSCGSRRIVLAARVALTAALTAGVLVPAGSASAAPSAAAATNQSVALTRFPDFAGLPDSAGLRSPVVLHGRLGDEAGSTWSGAQVLLSAWPSRETVSALPRHGRFATVPIARTVAGRDGAFELRSALTPLLAGLLGKEGLDVEVSVIHAGRQYDYLSNVHPVREVGAWVASLTDNTGVAAAKSANSRNLLDIAFDPTMGEQLPADLLRAARLGVAGWAPDKDPFKGREGHMFPGRWCTDYEKIWTEMRVPETIAITSARNGATALVTYATGASTESSAGASIDGGLSFGTAGSRSHTSEIVTEYAPLPSKKGGAAQRRYQIEVDHITVEKRCMTDQQGRTYKRLFKTAPDKTVGSDWKPMAKPTWKCDQRNVAGGGGGISTKNARAYHYLKSFGFNPLANVEGIPFNAAFAGHTLSGYTKEIVIAFKFDRTGRGLWCGHTGRATDDGQMVQGYIP